MKDMKETIKKLMPDHIWIPLGAMIFFNLASYYLPRLIHQQIRPVFYNMTTTADMMIPVVNWTIIIYVLAYPFWYLTYYMVCRQGREQSIRLALADCSSKFICGLIFLIIPTFTHRPPVAGTGLTASLMRLIYASDAPTNLFPSMHCLSSWMCYLSVKDEPAFPVHVKRGQLIMAIAVCVSTVTTGQHVLADILPGIVIAEVCWRMAPKALAYRGAARIKVKRLLARVRS